jgi:AcrR family transcriptional regulator
VTEPTSRNPEATRRRILSAALAEFASKGISGARVDRIAERARTNKRMLYHYFGSKDGLYRAVLNQRLSDRKPVAVGPGMDEADRMSVVFERLATAGDYVRLLMWEALERGARGRIENEEVRAESLAQHVRAIREAQDAGRVDPDLAPELLALAELALTAYPFVFPQVTRMLTGRRPDDAEFRAAYGELLRTIGARMRAPEREGVRG